MDIKLLKRVRAFCYCCFVVVFVISYLFFLVLGFWDKQRNAQEFLLDLNTGIILGGTLETIWDAQDSFKQGKNSTYCTIAPALYVPVSIYCFSILLCKILFVFLERTLKTYRIQNNANNMMILQIYS